MVLCLSVQRGASLMAGKQPAAGQQSLSDTVAVIKQFPAKLTAERRVRVLAPGKFFNNLTAAEARASYWAEAVEHTDNKKFPRNAKGWGAPCETAGVRIICESDAIDDPTHFGELLACLPPAQPATRERD